MCTHNNYGVGTSVLNQKLHGIESQDPTKKVRLYSSPGSTIEHAHFRLSLFNEKSTATHLFSVDTQLVNTLAHKI